MSETNKITYSAALLWLQNHTILKTEQEQNSTVTMATETTTLVPNKPSSDSEYNHTMAYVFILIGVLLIMALVVFVIVMIFRKNRLERLRHHLMPMYNFDPQEEDWESELLDDRGRRISYRDGSLSPTSPKLKLMNT